MKTHQELSDQIGQLGTQLSTAQSDLAKTRADLDRVRDDQQLLTGLLSTSAASLNLPWNIVTVDSAGSVGTFHCRFRQEVFGGRRAPQNSDLIDVPIAPPKEFP